ncbi:MAG: hypothetical protein ACQERN_05000 [Thermodesulfobacteriota bacterium]
MAKNFRIETNRTNRSYYLELIGDFDGSSAFELLNLLAEKITMANQKAFINTTQLKKIHPFGRDVFSRNFPPIACDYGHNIVFTGPYAAEIAPPGKSRPSARQDRKQSQPFFHWPDRTPCQANPQPMPGGE